MALFAALIVPWFVNWDDYKTNFEQEATRILGHPVKVIGSADASILPSPSLTFTDVRVGPEGAPPMMTVERFEVTIELMPLLQGQIHVTSMRLDGPSVRIAVDESGAIDWIGRSSDSQSVDPDRVALAAVSISDGAVAITDARTGAELQFAGISASVEARSLAGPWRVDGSYLDEGTAVPFHLATGRRLDNGTIRLTAEASPSRWPVTLSTDGVVSFDPAAGITYSGTYTVSELVENLTGEATPDGSEPETGGWRSEGAFTLSGERLAIDKAVLSNGPLEQPTSVAGSLVIEFGETASFDAALESRQLDLDRAFGGGPSQPVEVASATERLVTWIGELPIPPIPGRISIDVPAIVVGGSVIQDVALAASPEGAGWRIEHFGARLPGQASVAADGLLSIGRAIGFDGNARLTVVQPALFATWWRGGSSEGAGRQLSAFDIAGRTEISRGRLAVEDISARIGDATISGEFSWSEAQRTWHRHLGTDLKADRIDFAQLKALAELLIGRDLTGTTVLADSYSVILAADEFLLDDLRMTDVAVNAEYADDVLKIVRFAIGDMGGSSFKVTSGRIDELTTNMHGELTAELAVQNIDGLALVAGRLLPGSGVLEWLGRTADVVTPALVRARIVAPPEPGATGFRISVEDGVAGATTFNIEVQSAASRISDWRGRDARVVAVFDSPDSAALARQAGLPAVASESDSGAHIEIHGEGVPATGIKTTVIADFAGVTANANGSLSFDVDLAPAFAGSFGVSAGSLAPALATAGIDIPGAADNSAVDIDGALDLASGRLGLTWRSGTVAGRTVGGAAGLTRGAAGGWQIDADLSVDEVDFGWLAALGLDGSPLPTGVAEQPWSKLAFAAPTYGALSGKLTVSADRLAIGGDLGVANAKLGLALQPQRLDIDLKQGTVAGGAAIGGMSIHNVDGNATLTGQFTLTGAALESFVWRREQRAVATGIVDLSANFEATGTTPAGLVASMTGGGVLNVSDGEARYVDPTTAARQIIRASDLGQEFTEDALRIGLVEQMDGGVLAFGEAGGAFTIAAGTIRLRGLSLNAPDQVEAKGNAVVDLNTMTVDSDWAMTFDPGDAKVAGVEPGIGIVFRGPLAAPQRTVDALPFGSYLNTRREARILEIIAQEEADRAEREWFGRVALKLKQDRARAERLALEAAEAERVRREIAAAAGVRLEALHIMREERNEQLIMASRQRWAQRVVGESEAAAAAAKAAADRAAAARADADTMAAALPAIVAAAEEADGAARAAAATLATAEGAATAASSRRAAAAAVLVDAELAARSAMDSATAATAAAGTASGARSQAEAMLATAASSALAAAGALAQAEQEAVAAKAALDAAGDALSDAVRARDGASQAVTATTAALAEAELKARETGAAKAGAAQRATVAAAERDRLQVIYAAAVQAASTAAASRQADDAKVRNAEAALAAAEKALADATMLAANAEAIAEALASDSVANPENVAQAANTANAMQLRQAARKADVDRFNQEVELARAALARATSVANDADAKVTMARAGLDAATAAATEAAASGQRAAAANAAQLNALADATTAHDAAVAALAEREAAAKAAGAAFNAAEILAAEAGDSLEAARSTATVADQARAAAAATAAARAADSDAAGFAAEGAGSARVAAVERAVAARREADAAQAAAEAATATLAEAQSASRDATAAAEQSRTLRAEAEASVRAALADADAAEAVAAEAAETAHAKAEAASAAAAYLAKGDGGASAVGSGQRRQPISLVPEALMLDQPLVIVPQQ